MPAIVAGTKVQRVIRGPGGKKCGTFIQRAYYSAVPGENGTYHGFESSRVEQTTIQIPSNGERRKSKNRFGF